MTTDLTPRQRFLRALERSVRYWLILLLIAVVLAMFGVFPSLIAVIAMLGAAWVPILALIHWGRWLDEIINPRSDREEEPW